MAVFDVGFVFCCIHLQISPSDLDVLIALSEEAIERIEADNAEPCFGQID